MPLYDDDAFVIPNEKDIIKSLNIYISKNFIDNADIIECSYKNGEFRDSSPHRDLIAKQFKNGKVIIKYALPAELANDITKFYKDRKERGVK